MGKTKLQYLGMHLGDKTLNGGKIHKKLIPIKVRKVRRGGWDCGWGENQ